MERVPDKAIDFSAVAQRLRGGETMSNDIWQLFDQDEDKSIPMLLDVLERPAQASRSSIAFALTQLDADYHKTKVSAQNREQIVNRAAALLASDEVELRTNALTILSAYRSAAAIEPLKKMVRGSLPGDQRAAAEICLARQLQTPVELADQKPFFLEQRENPEFAVSSAAHFILADTYKDPAEVRAQARDRNTPFGSIPSALTALQSGNYWLTGKAADELRRDGVDAMPGLISVIGSAPSDPVRSAADGALRMIVVRAENRTPLAFDVLRVCLKGGNEWAASACANLLPKFDTPAAHAATVDCALASKGSVQAVCLREIVPPWGKAEAPRLRKLLEDKSLKLRPLLIFVLADNGDPAGLEEARASLARIAAEPATKDTPYARSERLEASYFIDALGYIGDEKDLALLDKFGVRDPRWQADVKNRLATAKRGAALRSQGGADRQIEFLKKQFRSQPDNWTASRLFRLMGDRDAAEFLFPFVKASNPTQPNPASQVAFQWLLGGGWIDQEQYFRDPKHPKLRDHAVPPEQ